MSAPEKDGWYSNVTLAAPKENLFTRIDRRHVWWIGPGAFRVVRWYELPWYHVRRFAAVWLNRLDVWQQSRRHR